MKIGQRVKILPGGGMPEFHGKTGVIIEDSEKDGRITMYRVQLDSPVYIEGVGDVEDDLWPASMLKKLTVKQQITADKEKYPTPELQMENLGFLLD